VVAVVVHIKPMAAQGLPVVEQVGRVVLLTLEEPFRRLVKAMLVAMLMALNILVAAAAVLVPQVA
jgi:hypothetical protein